MGDWDTSGKKQELSDKFKPKGDNWYEAAKRKLSEFTQSDDTDESEAAPAPRPRIQPSRIGK